MHSLTATSPTQGGEYKKPNQHGAVFGLTKRCARCNDLQPLTDYQRNTKERDGRGARCSACRRAVRTENADKLKAQKAAYYARNRERLAQKQREYNEANRDKVRAGHRRYAIANRAAILERARRRREVHPDLTRATDRARYAKNPEPKKRSARKWVQANPEKHAATNLRREARKRALQDDFSAEDMAHALSHFQHACAYCQIGLGLINTLHWDHFVPLSRNGPTTPKNMLPTCDACNRSKRDREPEAFLQDTFGKKAARSKLRAVTAFFRTARPAEGPP